MEIHGVVSPKMWYCPDRIKSYQIHTRNFQEEFGKPMVYIDDLSKAFTEIQGATYAFIDLNWWVPRSLEGTKDLTYPDVSLLPTRLDIPWPSTVDSGHISTRPIISDKLNGVKKEASDGLAKGTGGHTYGGKIKSCNSGYADGHVESRPIKDIKWELKMQESNYQIFY